MSFKERRLRVEMRAGEACNVLGTFLSCLHRFVPDLLRSCCLNVSCFMSSTLYAATAV